MAKALVILCLRTSRVQIPSRALSLTINNLYYDTKDMKPSTVFMRTKLKAVEDTTTWANANGTKVCAVSALLTEKGYKVTQNDDGLVTLKKGKKIIFNECLGAMMIPYLEEEYGLDRKQGSFIMGSFHDYPNFKDLAKFLKTEGL